RARRHRVGVDARARPRARRDDGGGHGALGHGRRHDQPHQLGQAVDDRREHRPQLPRGVRHQRQRAHRHGPHALRDTTHRQRPRPHRHRPPQGVLGSQLMTALTGTRPIANAYASGRLSRPVPWALLAGMLVVSAGTFLFIWMAEPTSEYNIAGAVFFGVAGYAVAIYVVSRLVEGARPAMNRLVTTLVVLAFVIALLPLISLMF